MKKLNLNKKGFTLIELLAIIVILAIIMVVTIPTVLNSMSKAKESQLQNAANSVAEWFEKQYSLDKLGDVAGGADTTYTSFGTIPEGTTASPATPKALTTTVLVAAGIADAATSINVTVPEGGSAPSYIWYNKSTSKMCVQLTAAADGTFDNDGSDVKKSSGC